MSIQSIRQLVAALGALLCVCTLHPQQHSFNVTDDIGIVRFGTIWGEERDHAIQESPDGQWLCVHTVRADEADDRLHDQLRFYRVAALLRPATGVQLSKVSPAWVLEESVLPLNQIDATITQLRWTKDNKVAFLKWSANNTKQLFLVDVDRHSVRSLTDVTRDVVSFDIVDAKNFAYTTPAQEVLDRQSSEIGKPARIVGNLVLTHLLYPGSDTGWTRTDLWSVRDSKARKVMDPTTHKPLRVLGDGNLSLSISPDRNWIATIRPYTEIPETWAERFPLPYPGAPHPLHPGKQDLDQVVNWGVLGEYIAINTVSGDIRSLAKGPDAFRLDWTENYLAGISWSSDGLHVFLPSTFSDRPLTNDNRPCSAVVDMRSFELTCMRPSKRLLAHSRETGYARLYGARFLEKASQPPTVELETKEGTTSQFEDYSQNADGSWTALSKKEKSVEPPRFRVAQDVLHPPVLVRTEPASTKTQIVFDPNPQLRAVRFNGVEPYHWSDDSHKWEGLLYSPAGYQSGVRYPLVIQNHGYDIGDFMPSGNFPSAFIAQELAAAGIMVLQVKDCPERSTVTELPCNVSEYKAAIESLSKEGKADPERVGLIGFSRTVSYTMKALVSDDVHFAAASITDGINVGYMAYLVDAAVGDAFIRDQNSLVGGTLLGPGMAAWLKNSPEFNTEKIKTPLRVASRIDSGILEMWEPYFRLWLGKQPAEMVVLNTKAHLIAQPSVRRAAQQGNLDWFRFWLQGFIDPDPAKSEQYRRWATFRDEENALKR